MDLQLFLGEDLLVPTFPSIPGTVTITIPAGTTASMFEITVDLVDPEGPMAQVA